jgi:hydroxymethylpyrimidine/phosphomethylpyrimidine kinase
MRGRVLIVAGSDSGGGAGIQADIKTVTALGGYAATAITALTAQNTLDVFGIYDVPAEFVALQMRVVLEDIGADCVKIGMLHRPDIVAAVGQVLRHAADGVPVVVDPVMIAKGGTALVAEGTMAALRAVLLPRAAVLTPNLPEAEALAGGPGEAAALARALLALGPQAVLVKGGHANGETVTDVLATAAGDLHTFTSPRIRTPHTHGTGCTLASAIAASLAQGLGMVDAVTRARGYVAAAIAKAPGYGHGHGPLDHGHPCAGGRDDTRH